MNLPIPILVLLSLVGVLLYASIAVAYVKTKRHLDVEDLIPRRLVTTVFFLCGWGVWLGWAQATTAGLGPLSAGSGVALFGGLGFFILLMVCNWAPSYECSDTEAAQFWEGLIWPVTFVAISVGWAVRWAIMVLARGPNAIGTYMANFVNEAKKDEISA